MANNGFTQTTFTSGLNRKAKLEEEMQGLYKRIAEIKKELSEVVDVLTIIKRSDPSVIGDFAIPGTKRRNDIPWPEKVTDLLKEHGELSYGEIVEKIFEKGQEGGLDKYNAQKRVMNALSYLAKTSIVGKKGPKMRTVYFLID